MKEQEERMWMKTDSEYLTGMRCEMKKTMIDEARGGEGRDKTVNEGVRQFLNVGKRAASVREINVSH